MSQEDQEKELKEYVKRKYSEIAQQVGEEKSSCCGSEKTGCEPDYTVFSEPYDNQEGYHEEADLGLGCGIPTEGANIREGDTVLDLGSGAGNDCFVARSMVGENGKVIGIDFAPDMIEKADANRQKLGYENVHFIQGDIDQMPLVAGSVDVILSNCVLNLVPQKQKAFSEMFRVLKPGGHFSISDIVINGELPESLIQEASLYAGCVSGAQQEEAYLEGIRKAGFTRVKVVKRKQIELPEAMLKQYLDEKELESFRNEEVGIHSITVRGVKSRSEAMNCCI